MWIFDVRLESVVVEMCVESYVVFVSDFEHVFDFLVR